MSEARPAKPRLPPFGITTIGLGILGLASFLLGSTVLYGWHFGYPGLVQIRPTFVPMQYNTALGFLLCGAGLLVSIARLRRTALALGALTATVGALTGLQYLFGWDLRIDELFMNHAITVKTSHPGRMAPNSTSTGD